MVDPSNLSWINHFLLPSNPVVFIDTDGLSIGLEALGPINNVETTIIGRMVAALSAAGVDATSIGIITPFRSQVSIILVKMAFLTDDNRGNSRHGRTILLATESERELHYCRIKEEWARTWYGRCISRPRQTCRDTVFCQEQPRRQGGQAFAGLPTIERCLL